MYSGLRASEVLDIITTTTTAVNLAMRRSQRDWPTLGSKTLQEDLGGTPLPPGLNVLASTSGGSPDFSLSLLNPNFPEAPQKLPTLLKIPSLHSFQSR